MKTLGTIVKRTISGKDYYYHKYLDDGKQKNVILEEREAYRLGFEINFSGSSYQEFLDHRFNLEVSYGESLFLISNQYSNYQHRFCFSQVEDFFLQPYVGKILVLYGLRRTGKTTLIFQKINSFSIKEFAKAAYIKCNKHQSIYQLFDDLKYLTSQGFKYIFIDEITLLEDFVALSGTISDIYGLLSKIVISGTDSLGFLIASRHELYDRYKMIHTTYISFKEFHSVLSINSIDQYIEYGGTMSMEGIDYNRTVEKGGYRINEYVDSSIIHNIIHSLESVDNGKYFYNLYDLYEKGELENVINRIIEDSNHRFAISVIEKDFKSHDFGSLKQLLSTPRNYEKFHDVLNNIDEEKLTKDLMDALNIINKEKQTHKIDDAVLQELQQYLYDLDVLASVNEVTYPSFNTLQKMIFTQPGLRYSQAKILVELLLDDPKLQQYDYAFLQALKEKLLSDVKGRMIEELITYETSLRKGKAFKMSFGIRGEYDMVVLDDDNFSSSIYEIKYSAFIDKNQYRYLLDEELQEIFNKKYYPISHRYVLYRGASQSMDGIEYLNIEDYLSSLE